MPDDDRDPDQPDVTPEGDERATTDAEGRPT